MEDDFEEEKFLTGAGQGSTSKRTCPESLLVVPKIADAFVIKFQRKLGEHGWVERYADDRANQEALERSFNALQSCGGLGCVVTRVN